MGIRRCRAIPAGIASRPAPCRLGAIRPRCPAAFAGGRSRMSLYTTASMAGMWRFPHYATHRPYHQLIEYAGWLRRLALKRRAEQRAAAAIEGLSERPAPLVPVSVAARLRLSGAGALALSGDASGDRARPRVLCPSCAAGGTADRQASSARQRLDRLGGDDRVHLRSSSASPTGSSFSTAAILAKLLARKPAVVTVNSTVGTLALACGLPVIALGKAVYDIAGLTFQGELDEFWSAPTAARCSICSMPFGGCWPRAASSPARFSMKPGLKLAVDAAVDRLEAAYARPARGDAAQPASLPADAGAPIAATSLR